MTAFMIVLAMVVLQAGLTMFLLTRVVEQSARLVSPALERVDDLAHVEADLLRLRTLEYSSIWSTNDGALEDYTREIVQLRFDVDRRLQSYDSLNPDPDLRVALAAISRSYRAYLVSQQAVVTDVQSGDQAGALWEYLRYQPSFQSLDDQLHALRHGEYTATERLRDQMIQSVVWARWPLGILVVLVALAEVGLGWHVARRVRQGLDALVHGARRIGAHNFAEPVPRPSETELSTLADTLNTVMVTLAAHDAERIRTEDERLRSALERTSQVVRAQEEERARISRELHDQAAQGLTALRYGLGRLERLARDDAISAEVGRLTALAAQTGRQISTLARDLRPSVLDDLGLIPALRSYAQEFSERIGVPVWLSVDSTLPRLVPEAETTLFRVVQEALTNVAKHAHAQHAWIDVAVRDAQLEIKVRDDGRGIDSEVSGSALGGTGGATRGLGLIGIHERVQLLGGQMALTPGAGGGACLRVTVPLAGKIRPVPLPTSEEVAIR